MRRKVSQTEAERKMKKQGSSTKVWKDVLSNLDLDGNGMVDYHEFMTAAVDYEKLITQQNLESAFKLFDTDGNGFINIADFKEQLPSTIFSKGEMDQQRRDTWVEMMEEIDTNNDGLVDFEEFCRALEGFIP